MVHNDQFRLFHKNHSLGLTGIFGKEDYVVLHWYDIRRKGIFIKILLKKTRTDFIEITSRYADATDVNSFSWIA